MSTLIYTARGAYILEKLGFGKSALFDIFGTPASNANSFIRSKLNEKIDLEDIDSFFNLIEEFPYYSFGNPRYVQYVFIGLGAFFLVASIVAFYKPQVGFVFVSNSNI